MSIIENVRGRASPKAPSPADIRAELALAEATQISLQSEHRAAALAVFAHEAGAEGRLRDLEGKLAAQRHRVETLKAAYDAAVEREAEQQAAKKAAREKKQRSDAADALAARGKAAVALSKALGDAGVAYRALLAHSTEAVTAYPPLTQWIGDGICNANDIRTAVQHELYRVSAQAGDPDKSALPGAQTSPHYEWQPKAIPSLGERITKANETLLAKLNVKAPG